MKDGWIRTGLLLVGVCGLAAGGALETVRWLDTFSGEICIGTGHTENVAIRMPEPRRLPFSIETLPVQRKTPVAEIPFQTPEVSAASLDTSKDYDVLKLPFAIKLVKAVALGNAESHDELRITEPEAERTMEIEPGKTLDIGGLSYQVETVRPWSGLLRESSGTPMALISLRKGQEAWTEGIFLMSEAWRRVEPSIGIRFIWSGSEEAANATVDTGLPGIESARWGVAHGTALDWFESFAPDTSAELAGGATVRLLRMDEQHAGASGPEPAIEVEWKTKDGTRQEWVGANAANGTAPIRFEYPARLNTVILICTVSEQRTLLAMYERGKRLGSEWLTPGANWKPEGATFEVRLDQTLERAVAVPANETRLSEVLLQSAKGALRVREGEAARLDDTLVQFMRNNRQPDIKYEIAIVTKKGAKERMLTVGPGDTVRYENCRLSQAPPCAEPLRTAALSIEYAPSRTWPRTLLAASLALMIWAATHTRKAPQAVEVRSIRGS